jgi:hypothetical protein
MDDLGAENGKWGRRDFRRALTGVSSDCAKDWLEYVNSPIMAALFRI